MATKKNKFVKLIEKKKSYRNIYYGSVKHQDKNSITFIGTKDSERIYIHTVCIEDYFVEEIPKELFVSITQEIRTYRDKKLDSAQFDLDDESSKSQNTNELILEALK